MRAALLGLFFLFTFSLQAQQTVTLEYNEISLYDLFEEVEKSFGITISYNSDLVQDTPVEVIGTFTQAELLTLIEQQSELSVMALDDVRFVMLPKSDESTEETLALDSTLFQLEEVLLIEYLTKGYNRSTSDGSLQLNPAALGILPGLTEPDVFQSLQIVPGLSSPLETASELHIRGGTPDQNLVLWDGIKIYHQGHFFGHISALNPYITDNISVFRGGTSVRYGDRVAGVIDVKSTSEIPESLEAGAGFNLTHGDVFIKAPLQKDKLAIVLSARRSFSDLFETITYNQLQNKVFQNTKIADGGITTDEEFIELESDIRFVDVNAKLLWNPTENDEVAISALWMSNNLDVPLQSAEFQSRDVLELRNNGYSAQWTHHFGKRSRLDLRGYLSDYTSKYDFLETEVDDETDSFGFQKNNTIDDLGASIQFQHNIQGPHSVLAGYEFVNNQITYQLNETNDGLTDFSDDEDDTLISHTVFGEYQFNHRLWKIRAGVRASYLDVFDRWYYEPRLFAQFKVDRSLRLNISGEIKNQSVSQLVLFDFNEVGVGNNVWVLADNDEIPVVNARQGTLGMLFTDAGWTLDVEGYYKLIKGLTSFNRGFASVANDYSTGTNRVVGVDVLVKKKIGGLRSWLGYSLSNSQFEFPDLQTGSFPGNFDQRHILSLSNTYQWKNWQFSLGWSFATGRPISTPSGISGITSEGGDDDGDGDVDPPNPTLDYNEQNNERLDSYHKLDASVVYDFPLSDSNKVMGRIGCSLVNIYGRENEIDRTFRLDDNLDDEGVPPRIIERTNLGLGFTPNIVMRIWF